MEQDQPTTEELLAEIQELKQENLQLVQGIEHYKRFAEAGEALLQNVLQNINGQLDTVKGSIQIIAISNRNKRG